MPPDYRTLRPSEAVLAGDLYWNEVNLCWSLVRAFIGFEVRATGLCIIRAFTSWKDYRIGFDIRKLFPSMEEAARGFSILASIAARSREVAYTLRTSRATLESR